MQTSYILNGQLIDNTTIKLNEPVPLNIGEVKVVIEQETKTKTAKTRKELYGAWKGKIKFAPDFNEPLECFKDYM